MNTETNANPNPAPQTGAHLTEDELDEVLMGIASAEISAHIEICQPCGDRLEAFKTQMSVFNQATMAWSESRSNGLSRDIAAHTPTPRLTLATVWCSAATAMLALAFGLTITLHKAPAANDAAYSHPDHDQRELATDNAMLAAIDSEMGTPRPTQFGIYENTKARVAASQRPVAEQVQD